MTILLWYILRLIVVLIIVACGFLAVFGSLPTPRRYRLFQKLPRLKGVFYFGSALEMMRIKPEKFLWWVETRMRGFDRIMGCWTLGYSNVYMKDPKDVQLVLNSNDHITKGNEYNILVPWLNDGLLMSNGRKWQARRKILTPAFHFKILEDNMIVFNKNARILCDKLEDNENEEIIVEKLLSLCTLDVIVKTAMGINLGAQQMGSQKYVNSVKKISDMFHYRLVRPHLYTDFIFRLSEFGRQFYKVVSYLHEFTNNVIKEKRMKIKSSDEGVPSSSGKILKAFLDRILEYEDRNPGSFSDSGIREEVDTFMFEGHDTTSSALLFIFYNLARHPEIQDKVYDELQDIFGKDTERDTTSNDLQSMVYLEKVIKESLRLHPSVPAISRFLNKDLILSDGTIIPAQTNIIIPIIMIHRNEKYWKDPLKFDPERFSDEETKGRHPYAFVPFSAGPRNCIGQKFALMELKTIVSTVIRKFKVRPSTTHEEIDSVMLIVLRSEQPIKCSFKKR